MLEVWINCTYYRGVALHQLAICEFPQRAFAYLMVTISDSILIHTEATAIGSWLRRMDKHYKAWHPKDHVFLRVEHWGEGSLESGLGAGAVLLAREHLGPRTLTLRLRIDSIESDKMTWSALGFLGVVGRLRGGFILDTQETGTRFTAILFYGWSTPCLGHIVDWLIDIFLPRRAVQKHVAEEGVFLKSEVEAARSPL